MQEDVRLQMIHRINGEKARILKVKEKINRLKELESTSVVQEYLSLKAIIDDANKITDGVILEKEKEKMFATKGCHHDICIFTQYSMYANGSISILDKREWMRATHVEFYCLDCASYISIPIEDEVLFKESHNVINPSAPLSSYTFNRDVWNLKNWRNHYFELLLENNSDEVYQVLKQEYDEGILMRRK